MSKRRKNKENANRAKQYAGEDKLYFAIGGFGAILSGLVYPGWGVAFGFMVDVIFKDVLPCDAATLVEYGSCEDYWNSEADSIRTGSFNVTYGWLSILFATLVGNVLLCYGFGVAQERMNKRVRDAVFKALMRQDMSYYDTHSLGNLATKIEEDAAMIHSFSGEPIRTFVMSTASVVVGLVIAFVYMWPVALMTLGILPFMGFGAHMEMKMYLGEDDGGDNTKENEVGPGAIVVETLLNIKTVASLTIQKMRAAEYKEALMRQNPTSIKENGLKGFYAGLGLFIQMWGMGLMFWWGAYCLNRWPNQFNSTRDFFISTFSLLFSLSGLSAAIMGATDQEKAKQAANRIFALIDTEGDINALSKEGKRDA
jgi:ATP-binding cassette subfamily B (MDR/TAP) protein 1